MTESEKRELLELLEEKERRRKTSALLERLKTNLSRSECNAIYDEILNQDDKEAQRELCKSDLFFLLTRACRRKDIDRDWLFDRCREVQNEPDGHLDLWAREAYKSTLITFGKSIQDILTNPNVTIGIFSHTRPIAKGFLSQIKTELEQNTYLKNLFPDVLYSVPQKESPRWSLDLGLRVKRTTNPKEETLEAWGVVDGQPTGKHFTHLVYDDVVTRESVSTPDQIKKTLETLELSYNLGAAGGVRRFIGTRYHANDPYKTLIHRGTVIARIKPATHNGKMDGEPVFLTREELAIKRRDMGPYTFSTQMLQDPVADKAMGFKEEWLKFYEKIGETKSWNKYLVVDPASKRKKTSDYTVMAILGLAPDNNYYLLKCIRDRLNLTQRAAKLFELHREFMPTNVGYEQYGAQADIEHMKYEMEQQNYRFNITELGGQVPKEDRIQGLIPIFEQGRFWIPKRQTYIDYEGRMVDLTEQFINDEYLAFPVSVHDDMLDCLARILDPALNAKFPKPKPQHKTGAYSYSGDGSWMG